MAGERDEAEDETGNLLGRRRFLFFCLFLCSLNCKFAMLKAVFAACRTVI